jgi:hypothetical protein
MAASLPIAEADRLLSIHLSHPRFVNSRAGLTQAAAIPVPDPQGGLIDRPMHLILTAGRLAA